MIDKLIEQIQNKYSEKGQDAEVFLKGLLHSKPINYWDYIETDTLLSLQKPKTNFSDEYIFIVYHQITELVLSLIRHELNQITSDDEMSQETMIEKAGRMERYTGLLINSFSIMNQGMDYEQYNQFRLSLAPASGFQSAQFRFIELLFTDIDNLINELGKSRMPADCTLENKFNYIYWQDAGIDHQTGKKSVTLSDFENRYMDEFVLLANKMQKKNLNQKLKDLKERNVISNELVLAMKKLDYQLNVAWPIVHLETAHTYLNKKGENTAATGGSHWIKYLHPQYQRRIFFPHLWSEQELENWGKNL
jgi:tryptophan 2,3-dioxygenase